MQAAAGATRSETLNRGCGHPLRGLCFVEACRVVELVESICRREVCVARRVRPLLNGRGFRADSISRS